MTRTEAVIEQAETVIREVKPPRLDRKYRDQMERLGQLRLPDTDPKEKTDACRT